MRLRFALIGAMVLSLAACAPTHQPGSTATLQDIKNLNSNSGTNPEAKSGHIRMQALRETAMSVGARAGLAWRAKQIDGMLQSNSHNLDLTYDFQALVLEHNILPPVLEEGRNALTLDNSRTIRVADRTYFIEQQARFATTPPNWRQYLSMDFQAPGVPNSTLLPRNDAEQDVWQKAVTKAWGIGVTQANDIFNDNLNRLTRDYKGMVLYRKLLAQHMISKPQVVTNNLGITGNGSKLSVNDRVLRITALPQLEKAGSEWKAQLTK